MLVCCSDRGEKRGGRGEVGEVGSSRRSSSCRRKISTGASYVTQREGGRGRADSILCLLLGTRNGDAELPTRWLMAFIYSKIISAMGSLGIRTRNNNNNNNNEPCNN